MAEQPFDMSRLARQAMLWLTPEEKKALQRDVQELAGLADALFAIDTAGVGAQPESPAPLAALRDDTPAAPGFKPALLAGAPLLLGDYLLVPGEGEPGHE